MVGEGHCEEENVEAFIFCGMVTSEGVVEMVKGVERGVESGRSRRKACKAVEGERIIQDRCLGIEGWGRRAFAFGSVAMDYR